MRAKDDDSFDIVICGARQASLTPARQLKLEFPDLTIAILDRLTRP